jgi:hypothetical protein
LYGSAISLDLPEAAELDNGSVVLLLIANPVGMEACGEPNSEEPSTASTLS